MMYTGTDVMMRPGGMGGGFGGGQRPDDGERPEMPEGWMPGEKGEQPEGFSGQMPNGEMPTIPEGEMPSMPAGEMPVWPKGEMPEIPDGRQPGGNLSGRGDRGGNGGFDAASGTGNTLFYMQDMVNFFSGLTAVSE